MTDTRKPREPGHSVLSHPTATRLAHWPPPFRGVSVRPIIMQHPRGEVPKRAKPRGWRLTRATFSEFEEDE
jgi:hypothetical protein